MELIVPKRDEADHRSGGARRISVWKLTLTLNNLCGERGGRGRRETDR